MSSRAATRATKLVLRIRNVDSLENGVPSVLELDQRGALIGRSAMADWSLPDPRYFISARHCEIEYSAGEFRLVDISTNGTFINGSTERLTGPRPLRDGDMILIGHYEVTVSIDGGTAAVPAEPTLPPPAAWTGWDNPQSTAPAERSDWDRPEPMSAISGRGAMSGNWSPPQPGGAPPPPPQVQQPPPPSPQPGGWGPPAAPESSPAWGPSNPAGGSSGWDPPASGGSQWQDPLASPGPAPPASGSGWGDAPSSSYSSSNDGRQQARSAWDSPEQAAPPPSDWSSAAPDRPPPPSTDDVWGRIAEGNVVDWARGGFGQPASTGSGDPLGLEQPAAAALPSAPPPDYAPAYSPPTQVPQQARADFDRFLAEAGVSRGDLKSGEAESLATAGRLLRRLVAGLVVMLEARARAKKQMGAETTSLELHGNNPIKFAHTPEQALAQLLNSSERGFMRGEDAVEDAFQDLQSHQIATLKAMQGALGATLDRFSPTAIRTRAESKGMLQRILPGARDAALWQAYEREFGGVARGSDEAFMDVFAKEFKRAYEQQAAARRRR